MIPTKEQEQKFWEWCGLRNVHKNELGAAFKKWSGLPVGKDSVDDMVYLNIDLNNLFKYAVSKLQDRGNNVELYAYEHKGFIATVYKDCSTQRGSDGYDPFKEPISQIENEDPALALFWAIYKVMEAENARS